MQLPLVFHAQIPYQIPSRHSVSLRAPYTFSRFKMSQVNAKYMRLAEKTVAGGEFETLSEAMEDSRCSKRRWCVVFIPHPPIKSDLARYTHAGKGQLCLTVHEKKSDTRTA
jgi:hypothetical protein